MEAASQSVLDNLIQRMEGSVGFAGLGAAIQQVSHMADADDVETRFLSEAILKDAALTTRLLKLSNSSRFKQGRNITTVDQAIQILGLKTVKSAAISLALLDSLGNNPQSEQLRAEIVAAYFCGALASQVTLKKGSRFSSQEAQVCGLLQNLGRMMTFYYVYEEVEKVRAFQAEQNLTEEPAVREVLGLSFEEIGFAVAKQWGLADVIQRSLEPQPEKIPRRPPVNPMEWNHFCANFAREITNVLFRMPENRQRVEIINFCETYRDCLGVRQAEVEEWVAEQLEQTDYLLSDLGFPCNVEQARNLLRKPNERVLDVLSSQDILKKDSDDLAGKSPVEMVSYYMRLVHDAAGFDRTLLCLPEGKSGLRAVFGVGRNANQLVTRFRCPANQLDIFRLVMRKRGDVYVADVDAANVAPMVPAWHREIVGSKSLALFSLYQGETILGLLYCDYDQPRPEAPPVIKEDGFKEWCRNICQVLDQSARK